MPLGPDEADSDSKTPIDGKSQAPSQEGEPLLSESDINETSDGGQVPEGSTPPAPDLFTIPSTPTSGEQSQGDGETPSQSTPAEAPPTQSAPLQSEAIQTPPTQPPLSQSAPPQTPEVPLEKKELIEKWLSEGRSALQSKNFKHALVCFDHVLELDPTHAEAKMYHEAVLKEELEKPRKTEDDMELEADIEMIASQGLPTKSENKPDDGERKAFQPMQDDIPPPIAKTPETHIETHQSTVPKDVVYHIPKSDFEEAWKPKRMGVRTKGSIISRKGTAVILVLTFAIIGIIVIGLYITGFL